MAANALTNLQSNRKPAGRTPGERLSLTAPQKAALIVAALGPEAAGPIIERISDKHLRAFTRAYARMQSVPREALKPIVEEFVSELATDDNNDIRGGVDEAREFLSQFKTSDEISSLMDEVDVGGGGGGGFWAKLERADDEKLAEYLSTQRPQIIAVVLSKINTEKASNVLNQFESDIAGQVILRLSRPLNVNPQALSILTETIEREFLTPMRKTASVYNPGEMIGAMMNNVITEKREALLEVITNSAPDIMKDVRKSMLTFTDIPERVPANAIPMAIKEVEIEDFLLAIKYGRENAPASVEFIFKNISQRMVAQYEEDLEKIRVTSIKDAEVAQATFMTVVRKLAKSGEIALIEPETPEEDGEESGADSEAAEA